jgi:hypothetical protein
MKTWQRYGAGLAVAVGFLAQARAQSFPGVPTVAPPPAAAAAAGAAAPAAPAAPSANLWSFLCPSQEQKKACKECLCQSQFGLLLNNTLAPLRMFTGGVVPPLCPGLPTAAELADKGPVGAAAAIKKDEAEAKARIAAVKYLGTVSCHYWPEAQDALIQALRKDRNECVRWQAALALGSGCCCTKKTIKALAITVSGSDEDGQAAELSERVKAAAEAALYHCLDCFTETVPAPEKKRGPEPAPAPPPEPVPPEPKPIAGQTTHAGAIPGFAAVEGDVRWVAFSRKVDQQPTAEVVAEARRLLAHRTQAPPLPSNVPPGSHGLVDIIVYAAETSPQPMPVSADPGGAPAAKEMKPDASLLASRPKDPEPPTDLYHVLMNQRKARAESKAATAATLGDPQPVIATFPPPRAETPPRIQPAPPVTVKTEPAKAPVPAKPSLAMVSSPTLPTKPAPTPPPARGDPQPGMATFPPPRVETPPRIQPAPPAAVQTAPARAPLPAQPSLAMASSPTLATRPAPTPPPALTTPPTPAPAPSPWGRPIAAPTPVKPTSTPTYPMLSTAVAKAAPNEVVPSAQELLQVVRESSNPFKKETAIDKLAVIGWPANGEVIKTLVRYARTDPAPTVRVHCIRALTIRNVKTPDALKTIQDLKADADPRVRHEAEVSLVRLGVAQPARPAPTLLTPTAVSFPGRSN